jgi:hypothetical protein
MVILAIISVIAGLLLIPQFRPFLQSAVEALLIGNRYAEAVFGAIK